MKRTLIASTVVYLLVSLTAGFMGAVTSPETALADGIGGVPPQASQPPDTTVASPGTSSITDITVDQTTVSLLDYAKMALQVIL